MQQYYKLPISFGRIIRKKGLELEKQMSEAKVRIEELTQIVKDRTNSEQEIIKSGQEIKRLEDDIIRYKDENLERTSPVCLLAESIAQKLHLILMTHFGEYRYDRSFGCSLWEHDFEMLSNFGKWQDEMILFIQNTIEIHEPRLANVEVKVDISQEEFVSDRAEMKKMKLRLTTFVEARIKETNHPFKFDEQLYISPISLD